MVTKRIRSQCFLRWPNSSCSTHPFQNWQQTIGSKRTFSSKQSQWSSALLMSAVFALYPMMAVGCNICARRCNWRSNPVQANRQTSDSNFNKQCIFKFITVIPLNTVHHHLLFTIKSFISSLLIIFVVLILKTSNFFLPCCFCSHHHIIDVYEYSLLFCVDVLSLFHFCWPLF